MGAGVALWSSILDHPFLGGRRVPTVTSSVQVDRPIEPVFDYMVEPTHQVDWSPNFLSLDHVEPGPIAAGMRFTGTIKNFGSLDLEYSEFVRPHAFKMATDHKMGHFSHGFTFDRSGEGTRVTQEIVFAPKGMARLMAPFMTRMLKKMAADLDDRIQSTVNAL